MCVSVYVYLYVYIERAESATLTKEVNSVNVAAVAAAIVSPREEFAGKRAPFSRYTRDSRRPIRQPRARKLAARVLVSLRRVLPLVIIIILRCI